MRDANSSGTPGLSGSPRVAGAAPRRHQKAISVAVVTAVEFNDSFFARGRPGQANGAEGSFGSRTDETQFFDGGKAFLTINAKSVSSGGGCAKGEALAHDAAHMVEYRRVRMAQNQGPPGPDQVDVAVAVRIDEIGPLPRTKNRGVPPDAFEGPDRAVDAAHEV